MKAYLTLIFIFFISYVANAQVIQNNLIYNISNNVASRVFLVTGDFQNNLNQKEFFFQIILEEGFENKETKRSIIINCKGNKYRKLFNNDCQEITKNMYSEKIVEFSKNGSFNHYILNLNNTYDVIKIENLDSKKSVILKGEEYLMMLFIIVKEHIDRGIN